MNLVIAHRKSKAPTGIWYLTSVWLCVLVLTLVFMSACTTSHTTVSCTELDWYELGREDGSRGLLKPIERQIVATCADSDLSLNEAFYNNGYDAGITQSCASDVAYELGRTGQKVVGRCPPMLQEAFDKSYQDGKMAQDLEKRRASLTKQLDALDQSLAVPTMDIVRRGLKEGERLTLSREKSEIDAKLSKLEPKSKSAPR